MTKGKILAYIILINAILAEWFHLFFVGEIHSYYIRNGIKTVIYWDDMVYYFFNELFSLILVIIIGYKVNGRAAKAIMTGIVVWFFIEWIEITLQLLGASNARLFINDGSWLQLSTCLTITLLVLFGNRKLSS